MIIEYHWSRLPPLAKDSNVRHWLRFYRAEGTSDRSLEAATRHCLYKIGNKLDLLVVGWVYFN